MLRKYFPVQFKVAESLSEDSLGEKVPESPLCALVWLMCKEKAGI